MPNATLATLTILLTGPEHARLVSFVRRAPASPWFFGMVQNQFEGIMQYMHQVRETEQAGLHIAAWSEVQFFRRHLWTAPELVPPELVPLVTSPSLIAAIKLAGKGSIAMPVAAHANLQLPGQAIWTHIDDLFFCGLDFATSPSWLKEAMFRSGLFSERLAASAVAPVWLKTGAAGRCVGTDPGACDAHPRDPVDSRLGEFVAYVSGLGEAPARIQIDELPAVAAAVYSLSPMRLFHGTATEMKRPEALEAALADGDAGMSLRFDGEHGAAGGWSLWRRGEHVVTIAADQVRMTVQTYFLVFEGSEAQASCFAQPPLSVDRALQRLVDALVERGRVSPDWREVSSWDQQQLAQLVTDEFVLKPAGADASTTTAEQAVLKPAGADASTTTAEQAEREGQATPSTAVLCQPWCMHPCSELNGEGDSIAFECGSCSAATYACRPGEPGWPSSKSPPPKTSYATQQPLSPHSPSSQPPAQPRPLPDAPPSQDPAAAFLPLALLLFCLGCTCLCCCCRHGRGRTCLVGSTALGATWFSLVLEALSPGLSTSWDRRWHEAGCWADLFRQEWLGHAGASEACRASAKHAHAKDDARPPVWRLPPGSGFCRVKDAMAGDSGGIVHIASAFPQLVERWGSPSVLKDEFADREYQWEVLGEQSGPRVDLLRFRAGVERMTREQNLYLRFATSLSPANPDFDRQLYEAVRTAVVDPTDAADARAYELFMRFNESVRLAFLSSGDRFHTPQHSACLENWFAQVQGTKRWRILPSKYSPYLCSRTLTETVAQMSCIDYLEDDAPLPYVDVITRPGDLLVFPGYWCALPTSPRPRGPSLSC